MMDSHIGLIFDIKEFAVHDGPGIRTTVFMKGCPLNCTWCHNPEGKSAHPQMMRSPVGVRMVGREISVEALAQRLNVQAEILSTNEGGVTFSGGEPLNQAAFLVQVIDRLDNLHIVLDTSGYASREDFILLAERVDLIYYDLKLIDPILAQKFTGRDCAPILNNLALLGNLEVPFVIRVPLIPGVTDTQQNLFDIAQRCRDLKNLIRVDLLTYNRMASGKYPALGMVYEPGFDENQTPKTAGDQFDALDLPWRVA